jgi:hypothetical protein
MTGHRTGRTSIGILTALIGPAIWIAILLLVGSGEAGGTAHDEAAHAMGMAAGNAPGEIQICAQAASTPLERVRGTTAE